MTEFRWPQAHMTVFAAVTLKTYFNDPNTFCKIALPVPTGS